MFCSSCKSRAMKVTIKVMPAAERDRTEDEASVQFNAAVYQGPTVKPSFQKLRNGGHTDVKEDKDKN